MKHNMASTSPTIAQSVEIAMLKADASFYYELVKTLLDNNKHSSILFYGIIPYTSLFIYESSEYLKKTIPDFDKLIQRQQKDITRASRIRMKLFDDNEKNISDQIEHLKWLLGFWYSWMNGNHVGWLSGFKRLLQKDVGLWLYDGRIISNTLVGFFNLGFEKDDVSTTERGQPIGLDELVQGIGYDNGYYINSLASTFGVDAQSSFTQCKYLLSDENFENIDVKNKDFFGTVYNGNSTNEFNASIFLLAVSVTFLTHAFSNLILGTPDTWFKIKFLTLYHVISSLRKLRDYFYSTGQFSDITKICFENILKDRELKSLMLKKDFRNILIHYTLKNMPEEKLNLDTPFFGMIEYFFDGLSFYEINEMIDRQLLRISDILKYWHNQKEPQ